MFESNHGEELHEAINNQYSGLNEFDHDVLLQSANTGIRTTTKRKRAPWSNPSKAVKWTTEMDNRLREAFALFPKDWVKTADYVGYGVKKDQCRHRWSLYVDPATSQLKRGQWTKEEEINLEIYVNNHINLKGNKKIPIGMIDWTDSVLILGRGSSDCQHKWTSMRQSTLKKGPWTPEEDKIIVQRYVEWNDRGQGLWAQLEKEIGRSSRNILSRWKSFLSVQYGLSPRTASYNNAAAKMLPGGMKSGGGKTLMGGSANSDMMFRVLAQQQPQHMMHPGHLTLNSNLLHNGGNLYPILGGNMSMMQMPGNVGGPLSHPDMLNLQQQQVQHAQAQQVRQHQQLLQQQQHNQLLQQNQSQNQHFILNYNAGLQHSLAQPTPSHFAADNSHLNMQQQRPNLHAGPLSGSTLQQMHNNSNNSSSSSVGNILGGVAMQNHLISSAQFNSIQVLQQQQQQMAMMQSSHQGLRQQQQMQQQAQLSQQQQSHHTPQLQMHHTNQTAQQQQQQQIVSAHQMGLALHMQMQTQQLAQSAALHAEQAAKVKNTSNLSTPAAAEQPTEQPPTAAAVSAQLESADESESADEAAGEKCDGEEVETAEPGAEE